MIWGIPHPATLVSMIARLDGQFSGAWDVQNMPPSLSRASDKIYAGHGLASTRLTIKEHGLSSLDLIPQPRVNVSYHHPPRPRGREFILKALRKALGQ